MTGTRAQDLVKLASIIKAAQAVDEKTEEPKSKVTPPKRRKIKFTAAYPSYSRSMLSQIQHEPEKAGIRRAAGTGAIGAVLGALIARLMTDRPAAVGTGALTGAAIGAVPGYISGKGEAETERSKLLFLKRMGITRPGELETLLRQPDLAKRLMEEGVNM